VSKEEVDMENPRPDQEALLLTVPEAAAVLRLSASTLKLMIRRGELPVVRCGRAVRIPRRELELWVANRTERHYEAWQSIFGRAA
jgi:excisionase family DNA binding protein